MKIINTYSGNFLCKYILNSLFLNVFIFKCNLEKCIIKNIKCSKCLYKVLYRCFIWHLKVFGY